MLELDLISELIELPQEAVDCLGLVEARRRAGDNQ
jgi:hypothetical protein